MHGKKVVYLNLDRIKICANICSANKEKKKSHRMDVIIFNVVNLSELILCFYIATKTSPIISQNVTDFKLRPKPFTQGNI